MAKTKSGARTANLSECQVTPVNGIPALRVRVPIVVGIMAGKPLPAVRVRVVEGGDPLRRVVPVAVGLRDPAGDEAAAVGQGDGRVGEARHRHRREREPAVRRGAECGFARFLGVEKTGDFSFSLFGGFGSHFFSAFFLPALAFPGAECAPPSSPKVMSASATGKILPAQTRTELP